MPLFSEWQTLEPDDMMQARQPQCKHGDEVIAEHLKINKKKYKQIKK